MGNFMGIYLLSPAWPLPPMYFSACLEASQPYAAYLSPPTPIAPSDLQRKRHRAELYDASKENQAAAGGSAAVRPYLRNYTLLL